MNSAAGWNKNVYTDIYTQRHAYIYMYDTKEKKTYISGSLVIATCMLGTADHGSHPHVNGQANLTLIFP